MTGDGDRHDRTDPELVRAALTGDADAFPLLVARHKGWLYRFIRRYVGNDDDALDLLQDSLVAAWSALRRFDTARPFPAWLRQIALNKCRDWSRRVALRRLFSGDSDGLEQVPAARRSTDPETQLDVEQAMSSLDRAIAGLPRALREPLILSVFEGLSHRETAQQLGVSEKAVETRIYRARQALSRVVAKADLASLREEESP